MIVQRKARIDIEVGFTRETAFRRGKKLNQMTWFKNKYPGGQMPGVLPRDYLEPEVQKVLCIDRIKSFNWTLMCRLRHEDSHWKEHGSPAANALGVQEDGYVSVPVALCSAALDCSTDGVPFDGLTNADVVAAVLLEPERYKIVIAKYDSTPEDRAKLKEVDLVEKWTRLKEDPWWEGCLALVYG